ncbi:site-specific recombinase, phage integrase family [Klebsiella michiganensis]|uniref:Site-specific recombinase, phage integrase family n=1 Tax=Klebsiella michiganensis TaxID=1134687 RepID=A0A7H4PRC7_9ENTR|nr:site-specific recombinase, phage integrase family [Klebsiella michiganensis]
MKPGRSPRNPSTWMVCALLLGCFRRKCGRAAGGRQKMKCAGAADGWQFCASDGKLDGHHPPRRREPLWPVTDETMRNWLKQAVKRTEADGVHFSIAVTPHTFRAQLYHAHALSPAAQEGHPGAGPGIRIRARWKSIPGYLRLDMAATLAVPFTADGRDAAEILRSLPPPAEIVGQAAGALPLSEGDKDKRIPDEAESVSRF